MKKNLLWVFALVAIAMVSCQKEKETINEDNVEVTTENSIASLPSTFTGTIMNDDTRTSYDAEGKFSWVSSDRVRLLVCEDLTTYSKIGYYSYKIKDGGLSDDGKTAVFTSTSSAGDLTAFVNGTWKSTGIAVYPESAVDRFSKGESHSYGKPWFTLAQNAVTGKIEDIMLTGVMDDDISNFKFSTAMAVLKITLRNIPASAATVKLSTSDKTNYPLDGDFALTKNGNKVDISLLTTYVSDFKGYQKVDISSEGEIAERSFYFNIPAAEYPENILSLRIENANGGLIMKRTIGAKMNIARNECLDLPELTIINEMTVGGNVRTPRVCWNFDGKQGRAVINQNSSISSADFSSCHALFTNHNESRCTYVGSGYPEGYAMSAISSNPLGVGSGLFYMHYVILSDTTAPTSVDDDNVICSDSIPFYYSSGDIESTYVGEYDFSETSGYSHIQAREDNPVDARLCHPGTGSGYNTKMTLAATDDFTKGNIMLTKLYNQTPDTGRQLYGYLDATNNKIVFPYPGDDKDKCFFVSWNSNYFYIASSETVTFSNSVLSSSATGNLEFSIDGDGKLTHSDYLMMKYTNSSYSYTTFDAFVYGKGLVFTK